MRAAKLLLFRATAIRINDPSYRFDQRKKRQATRKARSPKADRVDRHTEALRRDNAAVWFGARERREH